MCMLSLSKSCTSIWFVTVHGGVEWQKSTGIATSFAWQPVGKTGSGGKVHVQEAHKYMIHGPADRRPRVPGWRTMLRCVLYPEGC